jgi:hypothetical protein
MIKSPPLNNLDEFVAFLNDHIDFNGTNTLEWMVKPNCFPLIAILIPYGRIRKDKYDLGEIYNIEYIYLNEFTSEQILRRFADLLSGPLKNSPFEEEKSND